MEIQCHLLIFVKEKNNIESHMQNLFVQVMHDARETKSMMMSTENAKLQIQNDSCNIIILSPEHPNKS